jgi:hypothetical protein
MPSAQVPAVEAQPLIAVRNVRASSLWYAELLGLTGFSEHPHRDCTTRCHQADGPSYSFMLGTERTTPIS